MRQGKNLIVMFDGTGNDAGAENRYSNVRKLYELMLRDKTRTNPIYVEGIGTLNGEGLPEEATGIGLWNRMKDGYEWLTNEILQTENESYAIMLLGFSRGAYTAHAFSWLLNFGKIPRDVSLCGPIVDSFRDNDKNTVQQLLQDGKKIKNIEFLGVWDIVKSKFFSNNHNDAELAPNVEDAYHAMSMDECRFFFKLNKWEPTSRANCVWFAGIHSNVGGGYPDSHLSDISLHCMIRRLIHHGVRIKADYREKLQEDPTWKSEWKLNLDAPREYEGEPIHVSVRERIATCGNVLNIKNFPAQPIYVDNELRIV